MNLRDLRYLLALSEHRHFGKAAVACFVSQPTLSTQLRKLEAELGVELIERSPGKIMLTSAGDDIATRARAILRDVDELKDAARRSHDPETGSVRLGIFPKLGPYLLPHAVPRIRARFPALELLLVEEKSDELLVRLRVGRLDAVLLALPVNDTHLHVEPLFDEPFVFAVPVGHAYAGRRSMRVKDLRNESLLLLEEGHCLRDQALEVCETVGGGERAGFRATSLETLRQMVAAGVGCTLLPQLAVSAPVPVSDALWVMPFEGRAPIRRIGMLWRKSSAMSDLLQRIAPEFARAAKHAMSTAIAASWRKDANRKTVQQAPPKSARAATGINR
ncbi:MAG: LysR substrate-binding domain-containing protein [Lysobacterales bacterium]